VEFFPGEPGIQSVKDSRFIWHPFGQYNNIAIVIGDVVGDSLLGAKYEPDFYKIVPFKLSFQNNELWLYLDSSRNIERGSEVLWSKGPNQINGWNWWQDSAWFLPSVPHSAVYEGQLNPQPNSRICYFTSGKVCYDLESSTLNRSIDIYSIVGTRIGSLIVPSGATEISLPSLPIGSYLLKIDNSITKILIVQ
jgi:hypothetical protein